MVVGRQTMRVAVCICIITYRRPEGLARALDGLRAQVFTGGMNPDLRIVVVDNDEAGSAQAVCEAARAQTAWPLDYAIESRRGIPFARNRCVAVARPRAEWIAFIDDDEVPAPNWLAELLRVQAAYDADVVTGPVVPRFAGEMPAWAAGSGFFQRKRFLTGTVRDRAFTNNVLFRAEIFDRVQPNFDERMAMTGGSDAHFSRRAHRAGYRIVWADQAEVYESFPLSRVTRAWVYRRAYRTGTTTAFIARDLRGWPLAACIVAAHVTYQLAYGALLVAMGCVAGRHRVAWGVRRLTYAAGLFLGLFGARYEEYQRIHGA